MGILANSASKTMVSSSADDTASGFVYNEQVTLSTNPTGSTYQWGLAKPSGATSRSDLSGTTTAAPTFTPDTAGTWTITCTVNTTTSYTLRITVTDVSVTQIAQAMKLSPVTNASVPTPATGRAIFSSSDNSNDLAVKDSAGAVVPLAELGARATTVSALPSASSNARRQLYVSDEAGGAQYVFSDGTSWRRESDRAKVTALPSSFIINGQSNAAATPPVALGFSALTRHLGADIKGWPDGGAAFAQVVDGSANSKANVGGSGTGPGPGLGQVGTLLARRIATARGATVNTFALAYAGQGIDYFLPASATLAFFENNSQHATLNNYNLLKSYVTASGIVPQLYVWIQGEADAGGMSQATYYTKLKTIYDQSRIDYPGIRWVIVGTIGNASQRIIDANGNGTLSVTGVFAAQKQLADENPDTILFVDNRDMAGWTAWFGGKYQGNHYTTYAGYEEVAERIFAALQGATRAAVSQVMHVDDAMAWTQRHLYRHSISGADVSAWQGDIAADSLAPNTTSPAHVAYHSSFGYRSVVDFDGANSETMKKTGLAATSDWTLFAVVKTAALGSTQKLCVLQTSNSVNRVGFNVVGQSDAFSYFYDGADAAFDNAFATPDVNGPHTFMFVHDRTNLQVRLYVDGVLSGTKAITGTMQGMTDLWIGSLLGTTHKFTGQIAGIWYTLGTAAAASVATAVHAGAKVEFKL